MNQKKYIISELVDNEEYQLNTCNWIYDQISAEHLSDTVPAVLCPRFCDFAQ